MASFLPLPMSDSSSPSSSSSAHHFLSFLAGFRYFETRAESMDSSEDIDCVGESSHENYRIKQQYHSTVNDMPYLSIIVLLTKVNLDSMKIIIICWHIFWQYKLHIHKYKSINSQQLFNLINRGRVMVAYSVVIIEWAFASYWKVPAVHGEILVAGATWNLISNIDNDYSTQYSCFNCFSFAIEVTVTGP